MEERPKYNYTIIKTARGRADFEHFGWDGRGKTIPGAEDVESKSNKINSAVFGLQSTGQDHSYSVTWTLQLIVTDKKNRSVKNADISIFVKNQNKNPSEKNGCGGDIKLNY